LLSAGAGVKQKLQLRAGHRRKAAAVDRGEDAAKDAATGVKSGFMRISFFTEGRDLHPIT
jgi:hypothetical protein